METEKDHFAELAYSFYPRGISDQDVEAYREAPEFKRLMYALRQRKYLDRKWQELLGALQTQFECMDIGYTDQVMRGYRIAVVLRTPRYNRLVLNISKLIPYYCIYTGHDDIPFAQPGFFKFSGFAAHEQSIVNRVKEQVEMYFEGYKEFPPDLPLAPVEDVEFDEQGVLLNNSLRNYFKPFTLFQAFFSTNMFL